MNIHVVYSRFGTRFRQQRMQWFLNELQVDSQTTVLDVGGTSDTWENLGDRCPKVTLLNVLPEDSPKFPHVVADARSIPFPDNSFDVLFSNSLIEHVGDWSDQVQCAREMRRVAKRLWVQTPNRSFPLELHLLAPFIHWLPRGWQKPLVPFTPRNWFSDEFQNPLEVWNTTRLLGYKEMRELFPSCQLHRERLFGLTKSLIAI